MDIPEFKITIGNYDSAIHFNINQWDETKHGFDTIPFNELDDNYRNYVSKMLITISLHLLKSM